jgi:polyferredoxin
MKRQRVRKALILISFFLFPATINYFSPYIIVDGASQGIINGSFILFTLLFLTSLFLGRGFCGWVCPGAGLQEACFIIRDKKAQGARCDWIKYLIWAPWLGAIVTLAISAGGYERIAPLHLTDRIVSITEPGDYFKYFFFVGLIIILALTAGRRAFCHYTCWMAPFMIIGRKVRNAFRWPALHLRSHKEKCINCNTCTQNCPMSLEVNRMVQNETMENSECILCGTCIDGCSQGVIGYTFRSGNR